MGWFSKLAPLGKGLVGAMIGTALVLLAMHAWQLYWALRGLIEFVNLYGPKIQALP